MTRYQGRHGVRGATRPGVATFATALRRPAVGGGIALSAVAMGVTALANGQPAPQTSLAAFTLSPAGTDQAEAVATVADTDADYLTDARNDALSIRNATEGKAQEIARKKAAAKAKAKAEKEAKAKRKKQRAQLIENAKSDPQGAAQALMDDYGWESKAEFSCLINLWNGESKWDYKAYNPYSGATGIPQSLPGSKMASAGADWRTNPVTQIKWGLGYIKRVYGSPCNAWGKWQSRSPHWY